MAPRRAGARFSPNLDIRHPGFWLFIKLTIPIMLALSLVFTDDWIIRWFGSYLVPASITWLNYAKTLMRVPLGVVGQAVGVASFPFLAQLYSEGKLEELNRTLNATMKGLILLLMPDFRAHHRPSDAAGLSRVLPHAPARRRSSSHRRRLGRLFSGHVCLGGAEYSGAGLLRGARHADARHCRDCAHVPESAPLLVAGASLSASGIGPGEFRRNHRVHAAALWPAEPPHEESGVSPKWSGSSSRSLPRR